MYKLVWTPATGELLSVEKEESNPHDRFAVAVVKGEEIVGHVAREVSRAFYAFLSHGGTITCEVTGKRQHGNGLEVPCRFTLHGRQKLISRVTRLLQERGTPCSQKKTAHAYRHVLIKHKYRV